MPDEKVDNTESPKQQSDKDGKPRPHPKRRIRVRRRRVSLGPVEPLPKR